MFAKDSRLREVEVVLTFDDFGSDVTLRLDEKYASPTFYGERHVNNWPQPSPKSSRAGHTLKIVRLARGQKISPLHKPLKV
jgi:hypothetical protein